MSFLHKIGQHKKYKKTNFLIIREGFDVIKPNGHFF